MTKYWQLTPIVLFNFVAWSWPVLPAPIDPSDISVIDGDTIRVYQKQPNVRLVGFNAPETRKAQCNAERGLGARATRRVRNYGRRCGTLKSNGRDVGAILIAEGLAVPFHCGETSCPKTPKPWCQPAVE
jgi:endonuclease YncB( thermonuclease family)